MCYQLMTAFTNNPHQGAIRIMIYFAPLEGITTTTYRRVHRRHFNGIDKYFSPFIVASDTRSFRKREKREFFPFESGLVPQILTARPEDFVWAAKKLSATGYTEVNLNLGCPSGTVVSKNKGAGLLKDPDDLRRFFEEVFNSPDLPGISIKTRIGFDDRSEVNVLAKIFADYPFSEIIVHPRVRQDFYDNEPDIDAFKIVCGKASCPVCYNGDIWDISSFQKITEEIPATDRFMIGRGLIADPMFAEDLQSFFSLPATAFSDGALDISSPASSAGTLDTTVPAFSAGTVASYDSGLPGFDPSRNKRILSFLTDLRSEYKSELSGDRDVLFKLKEIWSYMGRKYCPEGCEKLLKTIRRTSSLSEYAVAERQLLS